MNNFEYFDADHYLQDELLNHADEWEQFMDDLKNDPDFLEWDEQTSAMTDEQLDAMFEYYFPNIPQ